MVSARTSVHTKGWLIYSSNDLPTNIDRHVVYGKFLSSSKCSVYGPSIYIHIERKIDKLESVRCSGRVKIYRTEAVVMVDDDSKQNARRKITYSNLV